MTWTPDACIFHFPCHDGFLSSVIAKRRWPECQQLPANYGGPVPINLEGLNVLIADFSFPADVLRAMKAKSIIVLDHHKTAEAQLKEFIVASWDYSSLEESGENIFAQFDMARSGAKMTWDFCFPGMATPRLVNFVQDRDLWMKKFPESGAVHLLLESYGYDYDRWFQLLNEFEIQNYLGDYMREAEAIDRYYRQKVADMAKTATMKEVGGEIVPVAYVPYVFVSDVGTELLRMHAGAAFVALIVKAYGGTTYSLRSTDDRRDVSEVAKRYGGGGHRNAAGFRVP